MCVRRSLSYYYPPRLGSCSAAYGGYGASAVVCYGAGSRERWGLMYYICLAGRAASARSTARLRPMIRFAFSFGFHLLHGYIHSLIFVFLLS